MRALNAWMYERFRLGARRRTLQRSKSAAKAVARRLSFEALEARRLLTVTASTTGSLLTVDLGAASDSASISAVAAASGGAQTIQVSGTGLSATQFSGTTAIQVDYGSNNQGVTFNGSTPFALGGYLNVYGGTSWGGETLTFANTTNYSFGVVQLFYGSDVPIEAVAINSSLSSTDGNLVIGTGIVAYSPVVTFGGVGTISAADGDLDISANTTLGIATPLSDPTGTVRLVSGSGISETSTISSLNLSATAASGNIVLEQSNAVTGTIAFSTTAATYSANNGLAFNDSAAATVGAVASSVDDFAGVTRVTATDGDANLSGAGLTINSAIEALAGVVRLAQSGPISQGSSSAISASALAMSDTGGNEILEGANSAFTLATDNSASGSGLTFNDDIAAATVGSFSAASSTIDPSGLFAAVTGITTSNADVNLAGAGLTISQAIAAGTGNVRLVESGSVSQAAAGTITAAGLGITSSAGGAVLESANNVGALAASNSLSGNPLTFVNGTNALTLGTIAAASLTADPSRLFAAVTGITTANGDVNLKGRSLAIDGPVAAGTGNFRLALSSSMTQLAAGTITAAGLSISSATSAILEDANDVAALVSSMDGPLSFNNGVNSLTAGTIAAASAAADPGSLFGGVSGIYTNFGSQGDMNIESGGLSITEGLDAGLSNYIRLVESGSVTQANAAVGDVTAHGMSIAMTSGNVILENNGNFVTTTLAMTDTSPGGVLEYQESLRETIGSMSAAAASIDPSGIFGALSGVSTNNGDIGIDCTVLTISSPISAGTGIVRLVNWGSITQTAAIRAAGLSITDTSGSATTVLGAANAVAVLAANYTVSGVPFTFNDGTTALTIGSIAAASSTVDTGGLFPAVSGITTTDGDVNVQSDGLSIDQTVNASAGAISLVSAGTNTSLTANGNVLSAGGSITLQATGNVTIGTDVTINSSTAPLTLAADVTTSGTGDDGTGTLTISSGATVATSGTITLRGAAENIDTSSDPAMVGATRSLATTPSTTLTGLSNPEWMSFDSSGNLYVGNYDGGAGTTVSVFAPGATTPTSTLTGLSGPTDMAFGSNGDLYVANATGNTISVFTPGSTTASTTLTGLSAPTSLAFYGASLYVANGSVVSVFAPGSTTPTNTLRGLSGPFLLAFDSQGDLFVTGSGTTVSEFAPGSILPTATLTGVNRPRGLVFDSSGNLYVSNYAGGIGTTVSVYSPGSTRPTDTLTELDGPASLAFDSSGNLYVTNDTANTVSVFAPGSSTPMATLTGLTEPDHLNFGLSGDLYVSNLHANTVSEFTLANVTPMAASVVIQSSVESQPMLVGGTNSNPVAGINLTSAELAQIYTTSTGTLTIGDPNQTGNITFSTATPATTPGAGLVVMQATGGAGQVILDDGAGSGTALNGDGGSISITAGTGGITALAASNSTAEISTTDASVTLLTAGPIGTNSNRIQFADDASTAQQVVSIGSTTIQPASVYLDGLGSLTLDNVFAYGSNSTVDVTARTNLVVASGGTVNAGSGPIMLGADLTPAETGDDGVGTLSISSGVTVTTTGTITLRGADVNLDTSSNPAAVGATRSSGTTAIATYSAGVSGPSALAFDSSGNLYVANIRGSTVEEFAPGSTTAIATYSAGVVAPRAVAFDSSGNLYVANVGGVEEFAPGSTTAIATYSAGVVAPGGLAFDSSGNLYVANAGGSNTVQKFAPGSTTPSATYSVGLSEPDALAFDSAGNLYVANMDNNSVEEFAPGSTAPSATYSAGVSGPSALAFASSGKLYVANFSNSTVEEFAPGSTTASATYSVDVSSPVALAIDSSGNLYVANANTVSKFAPGSTTASATYSAGVSAPADLAFDSGGNLYVANANTVEEFPPAVTVAAAGVAIQSSVESRPMLVGGTNSSPVAGVNLTSAELAQVYTTSTGTLTIGDPNQTGNITFSTATPATTPGAGLVVMQATGGAGQVILDDGAGSGTALGGNGGSISVTAGTGGITALAASDSAAEISTTGSTVTLLTAGPIGTSSNRIQFADNANTAQQVVSIGSTTIQPASVYLDGLGSLTLDNIIAYDSSPTIDVTARTNLVVASGGTINAGSGPIMLGADLTPAETGDDGVGTLVVSSGATVATTGSITLRGADVNIDASSNPAVVGATRSLGTTPSATYSVGVSAPVALAFDPSGNLYVADEVNNTVEEFAPGSTTPIATYSTGLSSPDAVAFDFSGNLYVANLNNNTVEKFAPGSTTPSATYSAGISFPDALALDSNGNLYVANAVNSTVEEFVAGSTTPSATYSASNPQALALDSSGNLYVANDGNGTVEQFAPGSTTASAAYTAGVNSPEALAFDSNGNLYVANAGSSTVEKFAPGSTTPSATYSAGMSFPDAMAFDSSGNLYVANGDAHTNTVEQFAPGSTTPSAIYSAGVSEPAALAFDSSGSLYVANSGNGTVETFSLAGVTPTAAGVAIESSVESQPMLIGGTNSNPVAGINLTSAELAQILTTSTGTITIGDPNQTGNITFATATPATTPGADLDVIQSTAGAGQVILDEGGSGGTALNGNGGTVTLVAGTGGIQASLFSAGLPLATAGFAASGPLNLALGFAPTAGMQLTIVDNTAAVGDGIAGTFSNLPQGGTYTASYLGTAYTFQANYDGGDGNDLVLTEIQSSGAAVIGAFVSGTAWNASYLSMLDAASLGSSAAADQGFELASGANQLTTMPWTNVDQISIAFSEPVNVSQSSLTLYNSTNTAVLISGFSYNSTAKIATWQFATPLAASKYVMNLAANSATDSNGQELDGAWTTSVSTFAAGSGNGTPGGDFNFYFDVLPGDVNNSGSVTNGDVLLTKLQVGAVSNASNYQLDVNASDNITNGDVLLEKLQVGSNINSFAAPQLPPQSEPDASPDDVLAGSSTPAVAASDDQVESSIAVASPATGSVIPPLALAQAPATASVVETPSALAVQSASADMVSTTTMIVPDSLLPPTTTSALALPLASTVAPEAPLSLPAEPSPAASPVGQLPSAVRSTGPTAPAPAADDASILVFSNLDQTLSRVTLVPVADVAGNAAPTSRPAAVAASSWHAASLLALDEVFSTHSDVFTDEFSALGFDGAAPAAAMAAQAIWGSRN